MLHPLIETWDADLRSGDPLAFPGYAAVLADLDGESVVTGRTEHYVLVEGDFSVIGGSMGVVHGERVVRAWDRAIDLRLPVVVVTRSGGARMQEGMVSLIQMGRTATAARRHAAAGLLSVAVHRSPTTGGVFASYGSLCDVSVAEAGATIGFGGPRVVEQVTGHRVDGRSHTAETARAAGLVDAVRPPEELAAWVEAALGLAPAPLTPPLRPAALVEPVSGDGAWAEVQRARAADRPTGIDVAAALVSSWTELGSTDPTVRAGLATINGQRAVVVAADRFAGTGRPGPDGFRLAQRAASLAGRLGLPLVSLVDTPGAEPGPDAENDGIAREIARTFAAYDGVPTPIVAVCVGEGGSGGALAMAHADVLLIQDHAIFSVIGPEAAAMILERDASGAPALADSLRLTSKDLVALAIADAVVPDAVPDTAAAVVAALGTAEVGRRRTRPDAASAPWLT